MIARILLSSFVVLLLIPVVALPADPMRVSLKVDEGVPASASAQGKYKNLLKVLHVPDDKANYGESRDWGFWNGAQYAGYNNIPAGHWVYAYPKWYIWKDVK